VNFVQGRGRFEQELRFEMAEGVEFEIDQKYLKMSIVNSPLVCPPLGLDIDRCISKT